jgi:two-component system cell cycle response regulator
MGERILVVDDEEGNRELLEAIFLAEGYTVSLAEDGPSALLKVSAERPDLILLDLLMPGMAGLEVCRRLKADPATVSVPIIVVTAVGQVTAKETLLTSGADDFVTKPIQSEDLRVRVRAMLQVRSIRQDLDRTLCYLRALEGERDDKHQAVRAPRTPETPPTAVEPTAATVLLVDDDPLSREFYGAVLTDHGFVVITAASGEEALALASAPVVEAVLLDIVIPATSGLEILETLHARRPELGVIMLTSHPTSQHAINALKLGALDFLVKGLDPDLVVLAVHRAIRHRGEAVRRRVESERLQTRVRELEAQVAARKA